MAIHFGTAAEAGRRVKPGWVVGRSDGWGDGWGVHGWSAAVDRHAKVVNHAEINTRRGHILHDAFVRDIKTQTRARALLLGNNYTARRPICSRGNVPPRPPHHPRRDI